MDCRNVGLCSYQKWKIGNDIRTLLIEDEDVNKLVGKKIFPIVAPEGVNGDFIVYERAKYSKSYTKMGVVEDECYLSLTIVSDNYDSAIDIAEKIDLALIGRHIIKDGSVRLDIDLVDSTENFEDNKYIEVLVFNIK